MTAQRVHRPLRLFRIGDPNGTYPIFDATGSTLAPGRGTDAATPLIYTAEHHSTALLEKPVHGSGAIPPHQHFIEIEVPNGLGYEVVEDATLPRWHEPNCAVARACGAAWQRSRRSLLLFVPSVVARINATS